MEDRKTKSGKKKFTLSGDDGEGVPPVPIPNTEVKPFSADGTWLETARESRSLPEFIFLNSSMVEHSAVNRVVVGSSPTWGAVADADSRECGIRAFLLTEKERVSR